MLLSPIENETVIKALQLVSALLIGMLVGGILMVVQTGHRLEQMQLERGQLLSQLQWYHARVEKLSDQLSTQRWIVVEEVNLFLRGVERSSPEELYLRDELMPYLTQLLGRRVVKLDAEVVANIFEGRVLEYEKVRYTLHVRSLVLARTTELTLKVTTEAVQRRDQSE